VAEVIIMKVSARNQLEARVKEIRRGPINAEVVLELSGGQEIVAVVTDASVDALWLAPGKQAFALIPASSVLIGVD
jgi:molybdate transport system regulatory protein